MKDSIVEQYPSEGGNLTSLYGCRENCRTEALRAETQRKLFRRYWFLLGLAVLTLPGSSAAENRFGFDNIATIAQEMAAHPYETAEDVPEFLMNLSYDQWRDIRFRTENSLWRSEGLNFEAEFFHPGLFYNRLVSINEIGPEGIRPISFAPELFDYGANH